jgi:anti-anti-sigma factor
VRSSESRLSVRRVEGGAIVSLPPLILGEDEDRLVEAVDRALGFRPRRLVLDFTAVTMINTAGVGVLVLLLETTRQAGTALVLAGVRDRQRLLLERVGFASHVSLVATPGDAFGEGSGRESD